MISPYLPQHCIAYHEHKGHPCTLADVGRTLWGQAPLGSPHTQQAHIHSKVKARCPENTVAP